MVSKHRDRARVISYCLVLVVLVHTIIIVLWAGPSNPIKTAIGTERVRSYVMPAFEQDWHIFAPTPKRVTSYLDFRAKIKNDDGSETVTPWLSIIEAENSLIEHNPFPPRSAFAGRRLSLEVTNFAIDASDTQRAVSQKDFHDEPAELFLKQLRSASTDDGVSRSKVNKYLKYDEMIVSLATLTAKSHWDGEIVGIEYRTAKAFVPRFEDRKAFTIDDANRPNRDFGWRAPAEVSDVQVEKFRPYADRVSEAEDQGE